MTEMVDRRFQRAGSDSNARVGAAFEDVALAYFASEGLSLRKGFSLPIGLSEIKKSHRFDLGSDDPAILVECKSHRWTGGTNVPSAKLTVWNEAMLYFHLAPKRFRKIFLVLKDRCDRRQISLAEYYVATHGHMIPSDVEIWEFDELVQSACRIVHSPKPSTAQDITPASRSRG